MKKIISLCLVVIMTMSLSIVTLAEEPVVPADRVSALSSKTSEVSPKIIYNYEKTVVKFYLSYSAVQESISYREYNENYMSWFSGTLYLRRVVQVTGGWNATYSGTLTGTL
ncbi:MAG: hypothetical protein U0L05_03270 [Schaedlerella sp.]|nr:hypothetical protein [Schaedlerella sp.]